MSVDIDKPSNMRCPDCTEIGHDDSGDNLFLLSDGETYVCRQSYHPRIFYNLDGESLKKRDRNTTYVRESVEDVHSYPTFSMDYRGVSGSTYSNFETKYSVDEEQGEPEFLFFPILNEEQVVIGYHKRGIKQKTFSNVGELKGASKILYGSDKLSGSGKIVAITEGHIDCLSLYQVLKKKYPDFEPAILSVNGGTGDINSISNTLPLLRKYDKIVLCFDADEAGSLLTQKVARMIGPKSAVMELANGRKDCNEALLEGESKQIINSFFSSEIFKPSGVVSLSSISSSIMAKVEYGLPFPYPSLNSMTYGLRLKEIITIASGPGTGKSSIVNEFIQQLIFEHKQKVSIFSLEESPDLTSKKIIGSILGKSIHLPDSTYENSEVQEVIDRIGSSLYLYDSQGWKEWDEVREVIRFQASVGVTYFFIDPITALTSHLSASEGNELLNRLSAELSSLVQELSITVFLCSHLNNANSGGAKDHGSGARVLGSQLTGSRALWRWSTLILGLSRDQTSEDEDERNTVSFQVIKNRFSGRTGAFDLHFNSKTFKLEERETSVNPEF